MQQQKDSVKAITYILSGSLFQMVGALGDTWVATVLVLAGFVIFYVGLGNFQMGLDNMGKKAAGLLKTASLIGIVAALLSFIPIVGLIAIVFFALAFGLELYAYSQLKSSDSVGARGKSGASLLMVAMVLAILNAFIDLLPFIGSYIAGWIALIILGMILIGWTRIQDGLMEYLN